MAEPAVTCATDDPARVAVDLLLGSLEACRGGELMPPPRALFNLDATTPALRRFKLDVSFALRHDEAESSRLSLNDKNEQLAFRARIASHADALGAPRAILERFFALSPPGDAQTTLGLKWTSFDAQPSRISLYYEELTRAPLRLALMSAVTETFSARRGTPPLDLRPAAVCLDLEGGKPVALKDYWMALERSNHPAVPLPPALDQFRRSFPLNPERRTRRYLLARRLDIHGNLLGHKLLWQSEAHNREAAERAWDHVERLRRAQPSAPRRVARALDDLRARFELQDYFLYPDLVSCDVDAAGEPTGLTIYVSVK